MENYSESIIAMIDSIKSIIMTIIEKAEFNKTFRATIIKKENSSKYQIMYRGKTYTLTSLIPLQIGSVVTVCAPQNNLSNLYIQLNANDEWLTKYIKL
jgi:hypothetical protein